MTPFVERKTAYSFRHGELHIYDTNTPSYNIKFEFDSFQISIMVSGHKTVTSKNRKVEFFPDFIYIPEKNEELNVDIPNASFNNPTKCYLLKVSPDFVESLYHELVNKSEQYRLRPQMGLSHFLWNHKNSVACFQRLCEHIEKSKNERDEDITDFMLKEFLTRLFQTDAKELLAQNFQNKISDKAIHRALLYIKLNLSKNISIDELTEIAGIGKTSFFKRFANCLGVSPVNYIIRERILLSKKLMKGDDNLQSVAFQSGFNTYEHFYKCFKKIERTTPLAYRKGLTLNQSTLPVVLESA